MGKDTPNLRNGDYDYVICSDIDRDGMFLEVSKADNRADVLLEIFYSDQTHSMTITLFKSDAPLEVVELAISTAKERLPPESKH